MSTRRTESLNSQHSIVPSVPTNVKRSSKIYKMKIKQTILVTGGCGFIGGHLVDELTQSYPECDIIVVDDLHSWQITSSNSSNTTAKSDKWKFYLSGEALTNYAPFPAELLTPAPDASVEKGNIELTWSVSDIDEDDSHKFDIYLDQSDASTRIFSNHSTRSKTITLSTTGKYYWRIVTIDNHGSNSDSGISSFTVTD